MIVTHTTRFQCAPLYGTELGKTLWELPPQFSRHLRNPSAIGFRCIQVAFGNVGGWAGWTYLGHEAGGGAQAVQGAIVGDGLTNPDHAELHRQGDEVLERRELVAA